MSALVSNAAFMAAAAPVAWTVEGVIERGTLAMLFGDPGAGKTFLALDWALSVATGLPWLGRAVKRGPVVYLYSEGGAGLRRRVQAWCAHRGVADVATIPMYWSTAKITLDVGDDESDEFIDPILNLEDIGPLPRLVVIDTLTGATPGMDQNSAKDMAAFAERCKDVVMMTRATVLIVHHSGHKSKDRAKGAIDLLGAVDSEFGVRREARAPERLTLVCTKMRNGQAPADIHLQFQAVEPEAVLVEASAPTAADKSGLNRGDVAFREAVTGEPDSEANARARFAELYGGTAGAIRNAWSRAWRKAAGEGLVEYDKARGLISLRTHT